MKTLLERLKPEYLEMLDEIAKKYPATIRSLKEGLSINDYYIDLRFDDAYILCDYCNVPFLPIDLDNLFTS